MKDLYLYCEKYIHFVKAPQDDKKDKYKTENYTPTKHEYIK